MLSVSGAMFGQRWRGDSGGLMHEEEFEGASESAEEEEVGGGSEMCVLWVSGFSAG